jgi:hypothetical protein
MPNCGAAERISTVTKAAFNPLISREIPTRIEIETEDQADGIRDQAFSGRGLANFH